MEQSDQSDQSEEIERSDQSDEFELAENQLGSGEANILTKNEKDFYSNGIYQDKKMED